MNDIIYFRPWKLCKKNVRAMGDATRFLISFKTNQFRIEGNNHVLPVLDLFEYN